MNKKHIISEKPRPDDPRQVAITEKIRKMISQKEWAVEIFGRLRELQIRYMREMLVYVDDANFIHDETQKVLKKISEDFFKSEIVSGAEYFKDLPKGTPVLIVTNHFGAYKLFGVDTKKDLGIEMEGYDFMYPYPAYFAALYPVAEALGDNLYYTSKEFPGIFGEIHKNMGSVAVPIERPEDGRISNLVEQTRGLLTKRDNVALVNFPEGTTSGKPSGGGPYDLEQFHTGGYVVASCTAMTIVPVAQYFNPDNGFKLRVFEPYMLPKDTKQGMFTKYAEKDRERIQRWLKRCEI